MKVLVVCNYSLLFGANRSLLTILENLKDRGFSFLVLLPSNGPITKELSAKGIEFKVVRYFSYFMYLRPLLKYLISPLAYSYNFYALPNLLSIAKQFSPDLIYSNTSAENMGIVISKILKVKHISHIREFMSLDHHSYFVLGRKAKRSFINLSDGVIFVSNAVAEHVQINQPLIGDKHIVIHNGVSAKRSELPMKDIGNPIRFASVGVLQSSKGHDLVIDFVYQYSLEYPNVELHIYGEGYGFIKKSLEEKIKRLQLEKKVFLHGFVQDTDMIYREIDLLCVFSRSEGFGRVTVEGMLNGVPVIGLNRGGTRELIEDGHTGFLVDDFPSFRKAVNQLVSSSEYFNSIRRQAFEHAKLNFSVDKYVDKVEEFFKEIVKK